MALSWNEIKDRALKFTKEWEHEVNEDAEAKSFLDDFFDVFGISRRRVASFEKRVRKGDNKDGYIDMLWKGVILIEMKSKGKDLTKAYKQATEYFPGLKDYDLPRYILVCDFANFHLYDLDEEQQYSFSISEFYKNVKLFGFIAGYQTKSYKSEDPVNIEAAELMGKLHDKLKEIGYTGHDLEVYLVRILFCLFAEDTSIFEKRQFQDYIELKTNVDGSDLAGHLATLFHVLNTAPDKRLKNLDEHLNGFAYVNGSLFEEGLPPASFDSGMRTTLLKCCALDWSKISPAIFGSMFQSVMNPTERRNLGAHYTSEKNILKLIKPLFLDDLWQKFESIKTSTKKLTEFHREISKLKFLDPACGCGNFLVITYRELRLLEIEILRVMNKSGQGFLDVRDIIWLDVDMMYGIEYEEFPAKIAEVAMWLMDHQMNMRISEEFGQYFARLPLKKAATIIQDDALAVNWETVVSKTALSYILGNPPFIGSKLMQQGQRNIVVKEFENTQGSGILDYVAGWYIKAAKYIQNTNIKVAFVSTNSITQGEQVSVLWGVMLNKYNIKIHFAHRTFKWTNEARGKAAVYCVILGFSNKETNNKTIYDYEDIKGEPHSIVATNINPYLVDAKNILLKKNTNTICNVPKLIRGSIPYDDGHLLLSEDEKVKVLTIEPKLQPFIKRYGGSYELINNKWRYCYWLIDAEPEITLKSSILKQAIQKVYDFRSNGLGASVKSKAKTPSLFGDLRQPQGEYYLMIPRVSSEKRNYIPIGFISKNTILGDSAYGMPDADLYQFGILTSLMHMAWVKSVCGRLKSDFRYSKDIVYNNYPWPEKPSEKHKSTIEKAAQNVLDVRLEYPNSSLADLYNTLSMPPKLVKAHNDLDKAVDLAYRPQPFTTEAKRMEYLFELYDRYTAGLFFETKIKKTS